MQLIAELLAVTLAANGLVDAWHNGTIFTWPRIHLQLWQEQLDPESWWQLPIELALCAFCHTYHVSVLLFVFHAIAGLLPYGIVLQAIVYGLAAARLSWILNESASERLQYRRSSLESTAHVGPKTAAEPDLPPGPESDPADQGSV